jgi:hypothetical protein
VLAALYGIGLAVFYLRSNPPKPEPTPATVAAEKDPEPAAVQA